MFSNSPKNANQIKNWSTTTPSTAKPTIAPKTSSNPPTYEAFHVVITIIQKTQNDTLAHYKSFSSSLNTKLNELKTTVDLLSSPIVDLKSENDFLRRNLAAFNNKVLAIESNEVNRYVSTDQFLQLLQEISVRKKFTFNAIIHRFLESTSTFTVNSMADNIKLLSDTT